MYKNRSRGFTLIELLVVIAIIGILSAVVLASLNTARNKGNDAAVKSNLDTIRTQSAIFYDTWSGYSNNTAILAAGPTLAACTVAGTMFVVDANVAAAITAADAASTLAASCMFSISAVGAPTQAWAVYVPLTPGGATTGWCVDSTGQSKGSSGITANACN